VGWKEEYQRLSCGNSLEACRGDRSGDGNGDEEMR